MRPPLRPIPTLLLRVRLLLGLLLLVLLLPFLAACDTPSTGSGGSMGGYSGNPAVQATLAARQSQDAAATYDAVQQAARAAAQATAAVYAQGTAAASAATAESMAAAASAATSTALAATGTAAAATATAEDLSVQGTQIALVAVQTHNAIEAAATGTHQAASVSAEMTAQAIHMTNAQMLQDAERQRLAAQQRRQEVVNSALPFLLALVGLALLILVGLFAYLMVRSRNPVFHVEHLGNKIAVLHTANGGYTPLPALTATGSYAPLPALPGNRGTTLALPGNTSGAIAPGASGAYANSVNTNGAYASAALLPQRSPRASWRMFSAHTDPATVPLGVNEESGQPVFLNRLQNPHLLIAGASGAGKTASGLIPFVAGNWGNQAHVVVINGRGSDFAPFVGQGNLTLWPAMRPLDLIEPLAHFLTLLMEEMYRRDTVLARSGVHSWSQLPAGAGQPGELLVAIDEFLTLINAAQETAELARLERDTDTARALAHQATMLWLRLLTLTNEGRKYGIYLAVTMTDPTRDAIGDYGMRLRRQMATIGFRMNSAASSRAFLDVSGADGLASGSVGLSNGRFVYNINGEIGVAIGFYPGRTELGQFFAARPVKANPLPSALADAIATLPSHATPLIPPSPYAAYRLIGSGQDAAAGQTGQAAQDGEVLRACLPELKTLNAAGSLLSDISGRPSGQFLRERLKPALLWLRDSEHNADANRLLERFND